MRKLIFSTKLFILTSMVFTSSLVAQTNDEYKMKIEKLNADMSKAMLEGKSMADAMHYTADVIQLPNNGVMVEGLENLKKANDEMMKSGWKVTSFKTTTLKVTSCGNMITEIGKYEMSITSPQMTEPMNDMGKYLTIWEKQSDGSLKIKVETWNTDMNPMMN